MINLKWHDEIPDTLLEIEDIVRQELIPIDKNLENKCSSLIFHQIFLTEDYEGPSVIVWGEENDDDFYHCKHILKSEYISLNEFEDFSD